MIEVMRDLIGRIEVLEQASANMIVSGTVSQTDHAQGLYKIEYGDDDNRVESPWIRPQEHAGTISSHMPFKKGQQVHMLSKGGDIGKQSWIVPAGHSDDNPRHSDDGDAPSWRVGNAEITMKNGEIEIKVGSKRIVLTEEEILTDGKTRLDNGNRKVHYKGGKDSDGDIAKDGADGVFV